MNFLECAARLPTIFDQFNYASAFAPPTRSRYAEAGEIINAPKQITAGHSANQQDQSSALGRFS